MPELQAGHDEAASWKDEGKMWLRDGGCFIFNIRSSLLDLILPISSMKVPEVAAGAVELSPIHPAKTEPES